MSNSNINYNRQIRADEMNRPDRKVKGFYIDAAPRCDFCAGAVNWLGVSTGLYDTLEPDNLERLIIDSVIMKLRGEEQDTATDWTKCGTCKQDLDVFLETTYGAGWTSTPYFVSNLKQKFAEYQEVKKIKEAAKPKPLYLNIFERYRYYGGPEEGGWWGDATTLIYNGELKPGETLEGWCEFIEQQRKLDNCKSLINLNIHVMNVRGSRFTPEEHYELDEICEEPPEDNPNWEGMEGFYGFRFGNSTGSVHPGREFSVFISEEQEEEEAPHGYE